MEFLGWFIGNLPFSYFNILQIFFSIYELIWIGRIFFKRESDSFVQLVAFCSIFSALIIREGIITWISYYISLVSLMIFEMLHSKNKAFRIFVIVFILFMAVRFAFSFIR